LEGIAVVVFLLLACESLYYKAPPMPAPYQPTDNDRLGALEPVWYRLAEVNGALVVPVGCKRKDRALKNRVQQERSAKPVVGENPISAWNELVYPEMILIDKSIRGGPMVVRQVASEERGLIKTLSWKIDAVEGDPFAEERLLKISDGGREQMELRLKWTDRHKGILEFSGSAFGSIMAVDRDHVYDIPIHPVGCDGS
jgi:hypothetical protein